MMAGTRRQAKNGKIVKALLQTLVFEIRLKDRSWIQSTLRVPIFRPPSGSVRPTASGAPCLVLPTGHP